MLSSPSRLAYLAFLFVPGTTAGCGSDGVEDLDRPCEGGKCDDAVEATCSGPEVHTLERPIAYKGGGTFELSYRLSPGTDPDAPIVIYLPGGPGQTSMANPRSEFQVPPEYGVVFTDPRGVGCNQPEGAPYPDEFYRSVHLADDVLAIADSLDRDYILYGLSYGTLLATVTAGKTQEAGVRAPLAVLLEGVLSGPFAPGDEAAEYLRQWDELADQMPAELLAEFQEAPFPLDLSAAQWGDAIGTMLSIGAIPGVGNFAQAHLGPLTADLPEDAKEQLRSALLGFAESGAFESEHMKHLFVRVGCREIAETNFAGFEIGGGELHPVGDHCADHQVTEPFHAGDWPSPAPIVYLNGTRDPNTPIDQAREHMDAQPQVDRIFVSVVDAGHNPLGLNLVDCTPALFASLAASADGVEEAIESCDWETETETRLAQ